MSAEMWTKEQFADHWYSVMPVGSLGRPIPCDCGEGECHGWRMIVTHIPAAPWWVIPSSPDTGLVSNHALSLGSRDTISLITTVTGS